MAKEVIKDELLNMISGGVLRKGWDKSLTSMIAMNKGQFGDKGKQMIKDLMALSAKDSTSPIEEKDMETINKFIDDNWDKIPAMRVGVR